MKIAEIFIFSEKIVDAIKKEYPGFANDLGNKIIREEAYAMIFFSVATRAWMPWKKISLFSTNSLTSLN